MYYNKDANELSVDGTIYKVISVEDHLEKVVASMTEVLQLYTVGGAIALDFSKLRSRGEKTSHAGVSSGAASFAKTLDTMAKAMTYEGQKHYPPIAILKTSHGDFSEFAEYPPHTALFIQRDENWGDLALIEHDGMRKEYNFSKKGVKNPYAERLKPIPNWELSKAELKIVAKERKKRAGI